MPRREGLVKLRLAKGETQRQTAEAIGMSETGYQSIELGHRGVRFPVLRRLARHFGLSIEEMARIIYGDADEHAATAEEEGDPVGQATQASH